MIRAKVISTHEATPRLDEGMLDLWTEYTFEGRSPTLEMAQWATQRGDRLHYRRIVARRIARMVLDRAQAGGVPHASSEGVPYGFHYDRARSEHVLYFAGPCALRPPGATDTISYRGTEPQSWSLIGAGRVVLLESADGYILTPLEGRLQAAEYCYLPTNETYPVLVSELVHIYP